MSRYEVVVGLEVHNELKTNSKVWCNCAAAFSDTPNVHCCPVCTGMPGSLPVLNKTAVEYTVRAGLALHCEINSYAQFDRKNYYYPDLSKAYQISQLTHPLCLGGYLEIDTDAQEESAFKPHSPRRGRRQARPYVGRYACRLQPRVCRSSKWSPNPTLIPRMKR